MTEKQLILLTIEEFHYSGRTNEHIAKVLHLPLDYVEQEIYFVRAGNKNIFPPSMYGA